MFLVSMRWKKRREKSPNQNYTLESGIQHLARFANFPAGRKREKGACHESVIFGKGEKKERRHPPSKLVERKLGNWEEKKPWLPPARLGEKKEGESPGGECYRGRRDLSRHQIVRKGKKGTSVAVISISTGKREGRGGALFGEGEERGRKISICPPHFPRGVAARFQKKGYHIARGEKVVWDQKRCDQFRRKAGKHSSFGPGGGGKSVMPKSK